MSLSKKLRYSIHDVTPTPLIDQQESLLAVSLIKKSYEAEEKLLAIPMKPKNLRELKAFSTLKRINDKQCILRSHRTGLQLSLLLFDLVLWLMVFSWNADNYTKSYLRKPSLNQRTVSGF